MKLRNALIRIRGRKGVWAMVCLLVLGYFLYLWGRTEVKLYVVGQETQTTQSALASVRGQNRLMTDKLKFLAGVSGNSGEMSQIGLAPPGTIIYQEKP